MTIRFHEQRKGFAPIIIAFIIALVLGVAGTTYYVIKNPQVRQKIKAVFSGAPAAEPEKSGQPGSEPSATAAAGTASAEEKALNEIQVITPQFDFSSSPLPVLNLSAVNLTSSGLLSGQSPISSFSINSNFAYKADYTLVIPDVTIKAPTVVPSSPPSTPEPPSPTTPPDDQDALTVNAANCAQFSGMPSAQYCSAVQDTNGRALCEQCKAAGL